MLTELAGELGCQVRVCMSSYCEQHHLFVVMPVSTIVCMCLSLGEDCIEVESEECTVRRGHVVMLLW